MFRMLGVFALIPTTMLLTVSFFVLFALEKVEAGAGGVKTFGKVIAVLLWICAGLVFSAGLYTMAKGCCPLKGHGWMQHGCGMQKDGGPAMMAPQTVPPQVEKK